MKKIKISVEAVSAKCMRTAAAEEKQKCQEHGKTRGIIVSGDGLWQKRGFSSLFGIFSLIGWYSGKVLDIIMKSKYCI